MRLNFNHFFIEDRNIFSSMNEVKTLCYVVVFLFKFDFFAELL